jgi:signal peptidase I
MFKKINWKEIRSFAILIIAVFAFRSTLFEPFRIPSGSMIPTLNIGDFIVVNKFSYGFKLPFSDMYTDPVYITQFESPKRDDVIVFKYPLEPDINYIKRVIGLPGDEVELTEKHVFVNGKAVAVIPDTSPESAKFATDFEGIKVNFYKVKEEGREFTFQTTDRRTQLDTIPRFKVPEGHYFVMGDNRDFSGDSRVWGFVPAANIKGKAFGIWMSLTLPFSEQGLTFSPSRIGKSIN